MARRLQAAGEEVGFVGLLDTNLPDGCLRPLDRLTFRVLRKLHQATARVGPLPGRALARARDRVRAAIEARLHATPGEASIPEALRRSRLTPTMAALEALAFRAFQAYRPRPYAGVVTFFRASVRPLDYCHPIPIWAAMTGGRLRVRDVPGDHFAMIRAPHVDVLARSIAECLEAGPTGAEPS
jgi:thioesterase domain-containing protein